MSPPGKNE